MSNFKSPEVAVVPAAGKGTRFLPSTKTTPKELLPLLNKPLIHHSLEELKSAGVKEVILVSHPDKQALNKYFADHSDLKEIVKNKTDLVAALNSIEALPKITMVYQHEQKGLAHAISCAKDELAGRDFFVLLPDEIFIAHSENQNPSKSLAEHFKSNGLSVISLLKVPMSEVSSYGVAQCKRQGQVLKIIGVVEKPEASKAPSSLILPGRYLFKNRILELIEKTTPKNGEVQLTDSIVLLSDAEGLVTNCPRFDGGCVAGFLKANVFAALKDEKIGADFKSFLLENLNLT